MNKYQTYKPTIDLWIGEIPKNWSLKRLKWVTKIENSGIWGEDEEFENSIKVPIPTTGQLSIDGEWYYDKMNLRHLSLEDWEKYKCVEGDIVVVKSSGSSTNIITGKSGYISKEDSNKFGFSNFLLRVRPYSVNSKFVYYFLSSNLTKQRIERMVSSTTYPNLKVDEYSNSELPIPSTLEQLQIVQFLDEKTELIDKLISTKERKITLLKEQRTTLINQVITKGLNPNVKMKDSGVEWIGEIPEDWDFGKLKYFTTLVTDGSHFSPEVIDEGRFYISVTDITKDNRINFDDCKKISNESFEELERNGCRPQIGDILVTKDGTIGRGCVVNDLNDFVILSSLGLIRVKPQHSNKYFLYYLLSGLNIDQMYSHIRGSGITRLTIKLINDLIVVIPTISEQHKIVEYLDSKTKEIDDLVQLEQKKIDLLKEYRQSLISEVVTGKIKVTIDE